MKKITFIFLTVISSWGIMNAQSFKNGDMVANFGLGFGWYDYGYGVSSFPAITASLEKGFKDIENVGVFSLGGIVGYKHASYDYGAYNWKWSWNDYLIAARGALHVDFLKNNKLDTYCGVALGLRFETEKYNDVYNSSAQTSSNVNGLFAIYIGGRYYFTDKLAGFGELGYGLGYLTLGLSYKLN